MLNLTFLCKPNEVFSLLNMNYSRFIYSFFLTVLLTVTTHFTAFSVCTLTANCAGGNWDAAGSWTPAGCGAVTTPSDACIIIIPACATVTVNINTPTYDNMEIYVYGTLNFGNGQKINMCAGYIKVFPGGQLTGGTPGSKINICGTTVWNGGTTSSGPIEFGGGTTLPSELISFNAIYTNGKVELSWITASETNNDHFTIERSRNGADFESVSLIDGAGTSTGMIEYAETDFHPFEGISYYRLKQTDYDGTYRYSSVVSVNYIFGNDGFTIYPNPGTAGSTVFMDLRFPEGKEVLVVVRDIQGKEFFSKVVINSLDDQLTAIDPSNNISAGTYLIIASSENKIFSRLLVVK